MMYLVLALASFAQVFALGFQSRNVNHGNYGWAAATSFFIGLSQAAVWRRITAPDSGWAETMVYACSGSVAIVAAMYVHQRFIARPKPQPVTHQSWCPDREKHRDGVPCPECLR